MQLSNENKYCEILMDWDTKETVLLQDLIPHWWGNKRFENQK